MSKTKAADAVLLLEQLAQVVKEGDNDVREVRIAKLSDAVSAAKCLNVQERKEAEALIKIRDWQKLKKYLEEI
jgi:hypothetical protein